MKRNHPLADFNPSTFEELMDNRPMYPLPVPEVTSAEWLKWYTAMPHWLAAKERFLNSHHVHAVREQDQRNARNRSRVVAKAI